MFIKTIVKEKGMTLMSVMVATALSGIIGLMVIRLMGNQAEAMLVIKLREERETLIKHYRQVVISGWDNTMKGGGTTVRRSRTGTASFPLSLKENLFSPLASGTGWWEVSATVGTADSGNIQHSDAYHSSSGLHKEQNYTVTLTVDFDPTKHEIVDMDLATRQEVIYMGYRWQETKQKGCGSDSPEALTRRDTTSATPKPLYHPNSQGAVVSYSFFSNYIKCSQVPLISNVGECPKVGAILGFESKGTGAGATPTYRRGLGYVTGRLACSYPLATPTETAGAWKTALGNERYYTLHNKVWEGTGSDTHCSASVLDKSYVDFVTAINSAGTGGGHLTCEPTLIAPHTLDIKATGNNISGCTVDGRGDATSCPTPYNAWNGNNRFIDYTYHGGGGGYQTGQGVVAGIRSIGHSGGIKEFNSIGSATKKKLHPTDADNRLRGRPGDRGPPGGCSCKTGDERTLSACKL